MASLLGDAEALLARYVGLRPADRLTHVSRRFEPGLCAYAPRHGALHKALDAATESLPGLTLTGDYVRGASIEACFRASHGAVTRSLARA